MRHLVLFATIAALLVPAATARAGNIAPPPKNIVTCGSTPANEWTNTTTSHTNLAQCFIDVAAPGRALVIASGTMARGDNEPQTRAQFRVGLDNTLSGPGGFVNVAANADDGTDRPVAINAVMNVPAGFHTIKFAGRLESGVGTTARVIQPTLAVVFVPDGSRARLCGNDVNNFTTTSANLAPAVTCTTQVAEQSTALVFGSATAAIDDAAYETRYGLRTDTGDIGRATRWLNVDPIPAVGDYKHAATSASTPVAPGTRTFSLTASRFGGSGTAYLSSPSVAALVLPDGWSRSRTCATESADFVSTTASYTTVGSCSLTAPANGFGLVYGSGSGAIKSGSTSYEARFTVKRNEEFLTGTTRYVNVATGTGDGIDETAVAQWEGVLTPGAQQFSVLGQRFAGTGDVRLLNPTVTAAWIALPDSTPPTLTVTSRPPAETAADPRFEFALNEPGTTTCALDGGAPTPCASGQTYSGLAAGDHTLTIAGSDEVELPAPPVTVTWKQLPPPPAPPVVTPPATTTTQTTPPAVVPPTPLAAPKVLGRSYDRRTGRLTLRVQVAGAGRLAAKATARLKQRGRTRTVTVGSASRTATKAATERVAIQLSRAARRARRLKVSYALTFTATGRKAQAVKGSLTIRR